MPGFEGLLTGHRLVDRYRIDKVIGRGGFAAVYRAVDERLDRTVAVKVITLSASNPEGRETIQKRFHREARAVARMHHPNVVSVYDFGTDDVLGLDFLVMELLEGEDLSGRLANPEPIPVETALRILRDVALGVAEGHRVGLIHRDLKPGNIFLTEKNRPDHFRACVLDFGIARFTLGDDVTQLTRSGGLFLSPAYASPEQLRGQRDITPAADVFSLGVIGYELLARERPFKGNRLQISSSVFVEPVPLVQLNPGVSAAVASVIHQAISEDPERRFADAGAFAEALSAAFDAAHTAPTPAPAPNPAPAAALVAPPLVDEVGVAPAPAAEAAQIPHEPGPAAEDLPVSVPPPPPAITRRAVPPARAVWIAPVLASLVVVLAWWTLAGDGPQDRPEGRSAAVAREASRSEIAALPASTAPAPGPEAGSGGQPPEGAPSGAEREAGRAEVAVGSQPEARAESRGAPAEVPVSNPRSTPSRGAAAGASAIRINREGEQLFEKGSLAEAADRFRRAVDMAPTNAHFRNNLGWALFQLKQLDEAARVLDEAARLDPRRAIVYANIGEVRWAQGDTAGAIEAYERFLELNTNERRERIAEEKLRRLRAADPRATP